MPDIKRAILFLFTLLSATNLFAQKVKIVDTNIKSTYETYHVLKTNEAIKDGTYKHTISGHLATEGQYKQNVRSGVWHWYGNGGVAVNTIDYDVDTIHYRVYDTVKYTAYDFSDQLASKGTRRALLLTTGDILLKLMMHTIRYPDGPREHNIMGKVLVYISLDATGKATGYRNGNSANNDLYEESVRVLKIFPLDFLPAYKDGQPISSEFAQYVSFSMQ